MDHVPVLISEIIKDLKPRNDGVYLDCTFGAGGYSRAILKAAPSARIFAIDRDPSAAAYAYALPNVDFFNTSFSKIGTLFTQPFDGIVFDLGVSSMQIDRPARGFSYLSDGPLDMRMGVHGETASVFVNRATEDEIEAVLRLHGDEKKSRDIAKAIIRARPILTTLQLADVVHQVVPRTGRAIPAAKTFQALRIHVNDELSEIRRAIPAALSLLKPGGKLYVVTFHSIEDRIVKNIFDAAAPQRPHVNKYKPDTARVPPPSYRLLFKTPVVPLREEVKANPRARSAKLRGIRRI